jgi:putative FmdB family regulatory protein
VPTYQYACTECGHQLEAVQSFSDAPLSVCTECQGRLRKVFSAVGVVFKGSGFYRTDSRASAGASDGSPKSTESNGTPAPATSGSNGSPAPKGSNGTPVPASAPAASAS